MLRQLSSKVMTISVRPLSSTTSPSTKGKWNLVSSVCIQRKPIIAKEMTELEKKMQQLLQQIEKENSWKSDWELQTEQDLKELEEIKGGDSSKVGHKLCRDWEDEWKAEFTSFKLQPKVTEDDKKNDVKSWHRQLDNTLILVVQQKDCGNRWILPHGQRMEGETMRQTAERALKDSCGEDLKVTFYGNAPCGFFKYKYPRAIRDKTGIDGDKIFFYKAFLTGGNLKPSPVLKDFKWVSSKELNSTLQPDYFRSVEMFLIDGN